MGFLNDVKDAVDKAVDEAEDTAQGATGVDFGGSGGGKNANDVTDTNEDTSKGVTDNPGQAASEAAEGAGQAVDKAEDTVQETTGVDVGGSGGGSSDTDTETTESAVDVDVGGSSSGGDSESDVAGGGTPSPSSGGPAVPTGGNGSGNDFKTTESDTDIAKAKNQELNQTERQQITKDIRRQVQQNPSLALYAQRLQTARNAPTEETQRQKDPVPFNPAARLSPGRKTRIQNLRRELNKGSQGSADLGQLFDPLSDLVTGGDDKKYTPVGPFSGDKDLKFKDVKNFTDRLEKAGISSGELSTITGREAGQAISKEVSQGLKPDENPVTGFLAKGGAGLTSLGAEAYQTATTDSEFNLSQARTVSKQKKESFEQVPANVIGELSTTPTKIQRRSGQAEQLASGELTPAEAAAAAATSTKQTVEYIQENPGKSGFGAATGFLVTAPLGTSGFRRAESDVSSTAKSKIDVVAEEVKRQASKGGKDTVTARDFIAGDVGERPLNPDELRDKFSEGDILMGRNVPDVDADVPTTERSRTEFLKKFGLPTGRSPDEYAGQMFTPESRTDKLKDLLGNKRKGQLGRGKGSGQKLIQKTKETIDEKKDTTGKDVSISDRINRISDKVRTPDNDRTGRKIDRMVHGEDRTRTEFNKPEKPNSDVDSVVTGSAGLGLGSEEGLDQSPSQTQNQDQTNRQPPEKHPPEQRNKNVSDDDSESVFESERFFRRDHDQRNRDRDDSDQVRRRERDLDFNFEQQEEEEDKKGLAGLLAPNKDLDLNRSLAADILGVEGELTEKEAEKIAKQKGLSSFQSPLSLRAFEENNESDYI